MRASRRCRCACTRPTAGSCCKSMTRAEASICARPIVPISPADSAACASGRPYWEEFFEFVRIQDAHGRHRCRDLSGTEPWACGECDCTAKLEARMKSWGQPFLEMLHQCGDPDATVALRNTQ